METETTEKPIDFAAMEAAYRRAMQGSAEPQFITVRLATKTKAVRRKLGRAMRRSGLKRGELCHMMIRGKFLFFKA